MKERTNQISYIRENLEYLDEYALKVIVAEINVSILKKETLFTPQGNGQAVYRKDERFDLTITSKAELLRQADDIENKIFGNSLVHKEYNFVGFVTIYKNSDNTDCYRMQDKYGVPSLCRILYYVENEDVSILDNEDYNHAAISKLLEGILTSNNIDKFKFQLPNTNFTIEKFMNGNIIIKGMNDKQRAKFDYMINLRR